MATGPPDMAAGGAPLPAGETCSSLSPTATEAGDDPAASSSSAAAPVAVLDKLAALEVARRAERDKRREDARALADPRESIAQFLAAFAAQQQGVDDALKLLAEERQRQEEAAGTGAPPAAAAAASLQGRLDGLAAEVLSLEQSAAAASYYLPPYDQRQCAGAVAALRAAIDAARGALVPRKRFAFSSKKVSKVKGEQVSNDSSTAAASLAVASAAAATLSSQQQPLHDEPAAAAGDDAGGTAGAAAFGERDVALVAAGRGLMGLRDTVVIKRVEEVSGGGQGGQDFVLLGLTGCTVFLLGHLPALRMAGLRRCRVFAGPVTGACFLDDVRDSQLALASYQVRIHRTSASSIFLRVRSNPIIEHSSGLRFAPLGAALDLSEPRLQALLHGHRLGDETGLWSQVDDFGWIKAVQSPNWCVMPDGEHPSAPERLPEDAWSSALPAAAGAAGLASAGCDDDEI